MSRREEWQKVLDSEVKRWSAISCGQLVSELHEAQAYEIELDSKHYQVEVELLENTEQYVRVMVAVDDGSLPASISPSKGASGDLAKFARAGLWFCGHREDTNSFRLQTWSVIPAAIAAE